jgi:Tfp pilus assembly protein FimV
MQQWSPFWRWLAVGVLAAMTIAWVAQSHSGGRETRAVPSHAAQRAQKGPGTIGTSAACANGMGATVVVAGRDGQPSQQVCVNVPSATVSVNGDGAVAVSAGGVAVNPDPRATAALQKQRAELQQQEAKLQQQQTQLNAQLAALQARLNSLGQ